MFFRGKVLLCVVMGASLVSLVVCARCDSITVSLIITLLDFLVSSHSRLVYTSLNGRRHLYENLIKRTLSTTQHIRVNTTDTTTTFTRQIY
jgi:uncharacterized membrane protein